MKALLLVGSFISASVFADVPPPVPPSVVSNCVYDRAFEVNEKGEAKPSLEPAIALMTDTGVPAAGETQSPVTCDKDCQLKNGTSEGVKAKGVPLCVGRVICAGIRPAYGKSIQGQKVVVPSVEGRVAADVICAAVEKGGSYGCEPDANVCLKGSLLPHDLSREASVNTDRNTGGVKAPVH